MQNRAAMKQYKQVNTQASVEHADQYTLTLLLFNGAVERLNKAKLHMKQNNIGLRGENISQAISIVDGLRASLDMKKGGEIAQNLSSIYDYIQIKLINVSLENKPEYIDEVIALLNEIRTGWNGIPKDIRGSVPKVK